MVTETRHVAHQGASLQESFITAAGSPGVTATGVSGMKDGQSSAAFRGDAESKCLCDRIWEKAKCVLSAIRDVFMKIFCCSSREKPENPATTSATSSSTQGDASLQASSNASGAQVISVTKSEPTAESMAKEIAYRQKRLGQLNVEIAGLSIDPSKINYVNKAVDSFLGPRILPVIINVLGEMGITLTDQEQAQQLDVLVSKYLTGQDALGTEEKPTALGLRVMKEITIPMRQVYYKFAK